MEMTWNAETVSFLTQLFRERLSNQSKKKKRAKLDLSIAAKNPSFGVCVLRFIAEATVDEEIRQCAAEKFKNHLIIRWSPSSAAPISDGEKEKIKTLIVPLILSATPTIRAQLIEALAVIGNEDFPMIWSVFLPEVKSSLEKGINKKDYATVNANLTVVNYVLKKFEDKFKSNPSQFDDEMLSSTTEILLGKIKQPTATLFLLIEAQRVCFCILGWLDVHFSSRENADIWVNDFSDYVNMRYLNTEDSNLKFNSTRCTEKEEELFQKYLKDFVEAVRSLLVVASASPSRERLTVTAIKFLTIVSTGVHHALFEGDDILKQIIEEIVIPNVMLRDEDVELFEVKYVEFIRRDMDLDTRRRMACELLKGIAGNYKEKITESVSTEIGKLLREFDKNPAANWKHKDCAIYLVVSLSSISTIFENFFGSVIIRELKGQDVNAFPMLKAGALKFFIMFHVLIPKLIAMALLGDVVRFLCSNANVVHSYAASCIEKLLHNGVQSQSRYTSVDINPVLPALMKNLFVALGKPGSEENRYIMRCILRVFQITDISSKEVALTCTTELTAILEGVCVKEEKNQVFNHLFFEAVAKYIGRSHSLVPGFEKSLLTRLNLIMAKDVKEFIPYVFQLLTRLMDLKRTVKVLPQEYVRIFDVLLLTPYYWENSVYVPALVRLIESFLKQAPHIAKRDGILRQLVDRFKKLMSSPSTEEQGFHILSPLIENIGYEALQDYLEQVWISIFIPIKRTKTPSPRLARSVIIFMSLFLVKHGSENLGDLINSVPAISFRAFLGEFWIPNMKKITGRKEVKLVAVSTTKLLCENQRLLAFAPEELLGKLLDGILTLLSRLEDERVESEHEPEVSDFGEPASSSDGYQPTFVRLHYAVKEDPLREINDLHHFLLSLLSETSSQCPRKFPLVITRYVSPVTQAVLTHLSNSYDLAIV